MPLTTLEKVYADANEKYYAIGQFNVNNLELAQAALQAAAELNSPIIMAASTNAIKYAGLETLTAIIRIAAESTSVPVILHLDHGTDLDDIKSCITAGFTSVMIDASHHPLDENIRLTREAADYAHAHNVTVEAELGRLGGIEDDVSVSEKDALLTDPDEAERFVEESKCDALAVAVGTSHGAYKFKGDAKIDFERIRTIKGRLGIPLVLHGASGVPQELTAKITQYGGSIPGAKGVPDDAYRTAVKCGINKINIDTDLRLAFTAALRQVLSEHPEAFDPRKLLGPARDAVKDIIKQKMKLFGSADRA